MGLPVILLLVAPALAQPVIDGVADPIYCDAVVVQDTSTNFGDNGDNEGARYDTAAGSELDGAFAYTVGGNLYVVLAGNLETNGNKLEIFFDTRAGGQNQLLGAENPGVDFGGLQRMGAGDTGPGLKFDTNFSPDFWVSVTNLQSGGPPTHIYVNYAELYIDELNPGVGYYCGEGLTRCETSGGALTGGDVGAPAILCTIDNSNVLGVIGGTGVDDGTGVITGVELCIPLAALGGPSGSIKICAFVNGQQHDFMSNQVLAGIFGLVGDNLGDPRNVDFTTISFDQFFTVSLTKAPCGRCCNGGSCSVVTDAECAGTWVENGSCDGNPCDVTAAGACCVLGICSIETAADCSFLGGLYLGDGTDCDDCACVDYGACCDGQDCVLTTQDDCVNTLGGNFLGPYTDCTGDPCLTGACCVGLDCIIATEMDCAAQDGIYQGAGTTCTPDPCVGGACCIDNLCFLVTEEDCTALGGTYEGDGTDCTGDPCDEPFTVPAMDGACDANLYDQVAVQNNQTQFGDSNLGAVDFANGSELDTACARYTNGRLYLTFAGNVESNFNKLDVFFDTRSGGQNTLLGVENPTTDFGALQRMGDDGSGNGMTFDADFTADFWFSMTGGNSPYQIYANYAELYVDPENPGAGYYLGQGRAADKTQGGLLNRDLLGSSDPFGFLVTIDNSNIAGVVGGTSVIDPLNEFPADVTTGVEVSIPIAAIGLTEPADIKVCAFINGTGHDFLSNQVLGTLPGVGNLGEPRDVDFSAMTGDQWFPIGKCAGTPPGDLNCDGVVNNADIPAFVMGLSQPANWDAIYGTSCDLLCGGDANEDGSFNNADIPAFIDLLTGK